MRNEGDRLLEAIEEALEIGKQAGTPVHIFHLKAAGRQNWGKMAQAIARIQAARFAGQSVTADIYPYINNGLGIAAFIHPRHFTEGRDRLRRRLDDRGLRTTIRREMESLKGWENWYRHVGFDWDKVIVGGMTLKPFADHNGKSLAALARATGQDEWDVFFELVKSGAFALPESMNESNKRMAMRQEFISFCTDVGPAGGSRISSHPRAYGAFPRILGRYVRDWGVLSLESAIRRMSANAANQLMIYDRGRIAVGLAADLVLFDAEQIIDRALLAAPHRQSSGIAAVLVNGQVVWEHGKYTGRKPGRVLRGPGYRATQD
jgi:N-acyl-D-amino-acid deacylase